MPADYRKEMCFVNKIFRYELRRLVFSKFFLGLAAVTFWYGWQILNTSTILGIAHTAPFSPWSFGSYLSQLLPLLSVILLFLIWNQCNKPARRAEALTTATAQNPGTYRLVKCGAAAAAWLSLAVLLITLGIGFLLALFGRDVPVSEYTVPALTSLLPPLILLAGTGLLAGRIHSNLLIAMTALVLGIGYLPLPDPIDLYSAVLFTQYSLTLDKPDPSFAVPMTSAIGKCIQIFVGITAFLASQMWSPRKNRGRKSAYRIQSEQDRGGDRFES